MPRAVKPAKPLPDVTARKLLPPASIRKIFETFRAADPAPKTELNYTDAFTLLVAVVLSAQSTDAGVNKATPALFKAAPTPAKMARLGEEGIKKLIATIGLFNMKARNLARLSQTLVDDYKGQVPRDREALEALPGVGRKTANVVLNVVWGESTMAVDTHVFRVANRTGLALGATPRAVEDGLVARIPPEFMDHAHHWLILHGRYICLARKPRCAICPVYDWCGWPGKKITANEQGGRDAAEN